MTKRYKLLERKEVEDLSKELPNGAFKGVSLYLALVRGWGKRTSQECMIENNQATETKISNNVGQGNVAAPLPPNSTEGAELLQEKVGVASCSSAPFCLPAPTGWKWDQH